MIRHFVLIRFRTEVTGAQIAAIFADLAAIRAKLPGMLAIRSGRSESPEQIEHGYLHGFTVDFTDWPALAAYQDHPDHKRVGAALVAAAEGGIDGILVFDLPLRGTPMPCPLGFALFTNTLQGPGGGKPPMSKPVARPSRAEARQKACAPALDSVPAPEPGAARC